MSSRLNATLVMVVYMNSLLLAEPQPNLKMRADAQPSPNQSLSIEEEQADQPVGDSDAGRDKPIIDEASIHAAGAASPPVGPVNAPVKPPTFLGRKRLAGEVDGVVSGTSQAPWYRTSYGALSLVLALMGVLYFGLKRWAPSMKVQDAGLVRVMGRTVVGPRQSLVLLSVGQRVVLVGVSPDRIVRVCEIADADEVALLTAQSSAGHSRGQFSSWLDREAAAFVDTEKPAGNEIAGTDMRSGSKSLSELLQKLRTTKV